MHKTDIKKYGFIISIIALNILFFFGIGQKGYIEMDDTWQYCLTDLNEGIMPIYPLLVNVFKLFFGAWYLDAVAIFQGILAIICVCAFLLFLKRKFHLKNWELYLFWVAAILPFAIELPKYVLTHVIYTEGIAYSLFYVFSIFSLNAILEKKWIWILLMLLMSIFMALIRPQLMLLLILCGLVCIYKLMSDKKRKLWINMVLGMGCLVLIVGLGVSFVFKMRTQYMNGFARWFENKFEVSQTEQAQIINDTETNLGKEDKKQTDSLGQVGSALICRAFYEAEADDYLHYDDPDMQEMFRRIYEECDKQQILYPYAKEGLWMWEDLTQTDIYGVASREIGAYLAEKDPEIEGVELSQRVTRIKIAMAIKEVQLHLGRFVYHCIRLMIPGFISCIFFNIEPIYLLCHLIVLFLYISAIAMAIYLLKKRETKRDVARFMLASVISCVIFVGVVNSIFFGMQRYFIYNMGVFYCAYYLAFREMCVGAFRKRGWNTALFESNEGS